MKWLLEDWSILWHAAVTATVLMVVMIVYVRINGLRSFAKMSSIDFVTTITIGSLFSSTIMSDTNSLLKGSLALAVLLGLQTIFSRLKLFSDRFNKIAENQPLLLMKDGEFLEDNMKAANVPRGDIVAKLREANAYELDKVHAVILETTGDISVLHGDEKPDPESVLYEDVRS